MLRRAFFLIAAILLGVCEATALTVHKLPGNPLPTHPTHPGFRLHPYEAKNVIGEKLKASAHLMDVYVGNGGGFDAPSAASVPAFSMSIPARIEDNIQLFYSGGESGGSTGWMIVPEKWLPWDAGKGSLGG
ncbi:MAG: hypothetical protein ACRD22_07965 [Terriglobia bacterium]